MEKICFIFCFQAMEIVTKTYRKLKRFLIFRKCFEWVNTYRGKDPLQKWILFQRIGNFFLDSVGFKFLNPISKLTFRSIIIPIFCFDYFWLVVHNLFYFRDDFFKSIQGIVLIGGMTPVKNISI